MATNYVQRGAHVTLTAPSGGVVSSSPYLIGDLFVVALITADAGDEFEGATCGVYELPKAAVAVTEGAAVYFDSSNDDITTTDTGNKFIGHALEGVASGAEKLRVRISQ